jgi:hypothetical protein
LPLLLGVDSVDLCCIEHPIACAGAGDDGVRFRDPEPEQVFFRWIKDGVDVQAVFVWVEVVLANIAVAALFNLFVVWLSYCGVDNNCVVDWIPMAFCAETMP